jgi:hypothetical protein
MCAPSISELFVFVIIQSKVFIAYKLVPILFCALNVGTEPVFVNLLRSPGIDSQPDGPVRHPYLSYRPAMPHRQVESNPRNRFLVSLNVYKYGLSTLSSTSQSPYL